MMNDKLSDAVDCYLNNYTDILNNFPLDGQKQISKYHEVNCHHMPILNKLDLYSKNSKQLTSANGQQLKQMLINSLELADRKVNISEHLLDLVNDKVFKLNMSFKNIKMSQVSKINKSNMTSKKMLKWMPNYKKIDSDSLLDISSMDDTNYNSDKNKKKITKTLNKDVQTKVNLKNNIQNRKTISTNTNQKQLNNTTTDRNLRKKQSNRRKTYSENFAVSDVEPTYCICEDVSYGNMVCCDNDLCPIEWFHFNCVSLRKKPKGKWYCPRCRGTNSTKMKCRQIFFLELAEYNKQKEQD